MAIIERGVSGFSGDEARGNVMPPIAVIGVTGFSGDEAKGKSFSNPDFKGLAGFSGDEALGKSFQNPDFKGGSGFSGDEARDLSAQAPQEGVGLDPAPGSLGVLVPKLTMQFAKSPVLLTGTLTVRELHTNTLVEAIPNFSTNPQVSVSGVRVFVQLSAEFDPAARGYYVQAGADLVVDWAGIPAVSDRTAWFFTARKVPQDLRRPQ